jgi:hypothetical protein
MVNLSKVTSLEVGGGGGGWYIYSPRFLELFNRKLTCEAALFRSHMKNGDKKCADQNTLCRRITYRAELRDFLVSHPCPGKIPDGHLVFRS